MNDYKDENLKSAIKTFGIIVSIIVALVIFIL
jgi:hypothetical protein